jgi:transcriptional regulator with XRE-family HTH domain
MEDDLHPLRRWRMEKGVTLATLAKAVGVSPSHLSEIERLIDCPSLDLASRLSFATVGEDGRPAVEVKEFVRSEAAE